MSDMRHHHLDHPVVPPSASEIRAWQLTAVRDCVSVLRNESAELNDPSLRPELSNFFSRAPTLWKEMSALALSVVNAWDETSPPAEEEVQEFLGLLRRVNMTLGSVVHPPRSSYECGRVGDDIEDAAHHFILTVLATPAIAHTSFEQLKRNVIGFGADYRVVSNSEGSREWALSKSNLAWLQFTMKHTADKCNLVKHILDLDLDTCRYGDGFKFYKNRKSSADRAKMNEALAELNAAEAITFNHRQRELFAQLANSARSYALTLEPYIVTREKYHIEIESAWRHVEQSLRQVNAQPEASVAKRSANHRPIVLRTQK